MMEQKLTAEARQERGKGAARKIRAAGRVPGVVYGGGEPVAISVDSRDLNHVLHTDAGANVLVDLRIGKDRCLAMPREIQRDHLRDRLVHVDFLRIARDRKIAVEVPIQIVGDSHGVREGGVVEHHLWSLQLESLPQDVPAGIEADISSLGIGESLRVEDLSVPEKLTVLTGGGELVVSVVPPQAMRVEEEAAAVAEGAEAEAPAAAEGSEAGSGDEESAG